MNPAVLRRVKVCLAAAIFVLTFVSPAAADSIKMAWDANIDSVAGYRVHVGVQPGSYTEHMDVGLSTSYTYSTATAGQQYCFAVSAYSSASVEGPTSQEVCGYSNAPPTLQNPGTQSSNVGQSISLQLVASDPESHPLTFDATGLPPGISIMASTGLISGAGTATGNYSVTARASDSVTSTSQTFAWTITTPPLMDTTPPTVTITGPTSAPTYTTSSSVLALSGTASDNAAVSQVSWVNDRGGNGVASGTTNWSVSTIPLLSGTNTLTVQARDSAGNLANAVLTVSMNTTPPSGGDTSPPSVTITSPTSGTSYVTSSDSVVISGTSTDDVGVIQVTWVSSRGDSGLANGTTNWSTSSIPLKSGPNVITIDVRDAAGNNTTDKLTVYRRN